MYVIGHAAALENPSAAHTRACVVSAAVAIAESGRLLSRRRPSVEHAVPSPQALQRSRARGQQKRSSVSCPGALQHSPAKLRVVTNQLAWRLWSGMPSARQGT